MLLTLPRFAPDIAPSISLNASRLDRLHLARYLLQAGVLRQADIPPRWTDALAVCQAALDAWVKREVGPLRCLHPSFMLSPVEPFAPRARADSGALEPEYSEADLRWSMRAQQWPIGVGLERLEAAHPGLGATALDILSQRANFVAPLFTPVVAEYWAEHLYWYGEANEEAALMECCGNDASEREAMRADMVTRALFDQAYPAWALKPHQHRLSTTRLRRLLDAPVDTPTRELIADLLRLERLKADNTYWPDLDGEFVGYAALLSWRSDDLTLRVFDDGMESSYQGECWDVIGLHRVSLTAPQEMRDWRTAMTRRLHAIALIDGLIWRLATADCEDSSSHSTEFVTS